MRQLRRTKNRRLGLLALVKILAHADALATPILPPQPPTPQRENSVLLILGLGRVGLEVAHQAASCFCDIFGTIRSEGDFHENNNDNNNNHPNPETTTSDGDGFVRRVPFHNTEYLAILSQTCTHLLVTVPPSSPGKSKSEADSSAFLDSVFDAVTESLPRSSWIGVISTTGVYGNHDGSWVTEESPCRSSSSTAARYLDYEQAWKDRARQHNVRLTIFRCSGIYGPTQSALHTVFRSGVASPSMEMNNPPSDITNRIHVSDLAAAVVASMKIMNGEWNDIPTKRILTDDNQCTIYNLSDDLPASRLQIMTYAKELLQSVNANVPIASNVVHSGGRAQRRTTDQKRVCNDKMKKDLFHDTAMKYPTYKEGLGAILHERTNPWWD